MEQYQLDARVPGIHPGRYPFKFWVAGVNFWEDRWGQKPSWLQGKYVKEILGEEVDGFLDDRVAQAWFFRAWWQAHEDIWSPGYSRTIHSSQLFGSIEKET